MTKVKHPAPRCDQTPAWQALHQHFDAAGPSFDMRTAFAQQPNRAKELTLKLPAWWWTLQNLVDHRDLGLAAGRGQSL